MIWIVFALMTGAAALCALWPLSRRRAKREGEARTIAFYKAQLLEIDRDVERGQMPPAEAAGARAEAARRLIAASERAGASESPDDGAALLRRRAAALALLVGVPLIALGLYFSLGSPELPDEPILARLTDPARGNDLGAAVARIEAHLLAHPDDGRGFEVIAPAYMRLSRYDEAAKAYGEALRLLGDDPDRRANYGEALVAAASGVVTADARAAFQQALAAKPDIAKARYYIALAAEQDGDRARAVDLYAKLLADAPPSASWGPAVRARLAGLGGEEGAAIASLAPDQRQQAIRGMVDRLATRLAANGDDAAGWLRLIRAYSVLQEPDKAKAALAKAREALASNEAAKRDLDALARELGLEG